MSTTDSGSKNPFHSLQIYLARQYAKLYLPQKFIAVTGSIGKTTCVQACSAVLSHKFKTISSKPDQDLFSRIPQTLLRLTPKVEKVILEMGIKKKGEMDFYLSMIRPQVVVVTRISYSDNEFLGDLDSVIEQEGKLIEQLDQSGVAILNYDDPNSRKLAKICKGTVVYYGTDPQNCTIWADNFKIENFRTNF